MARLLDMIRKMREGTAEMPPVARLVGFTIDSLERDRVVMRFVAEERHSNPMGTLHGGILCDVADAAMAMSWATGLEDDESLTTLEIKISFLRPFWTGLLLAEGHVLNRGKTTGLTECHVRDEKGRLVAHATSTLLTLRGSMAEGR